MGAWRPRLYEGVTLLHAGLLVVLVPIVGHVQFDFRGTATGAIPGAMLFFGELLLGGVVLRLVLARLCGGRAVVKRVFRSYASVRTLVDVVRLIVVTAVMSSAYAWLKLLVPLLNRALFDDVLYAVDNAIHFGVNPNRFLMALFPSPAVRRFMDWEYAAFFASMMAGFGWFASTTSVKERARFAAGFTFLWLVASWIYLAVPSLGPCFVFPDEYQTARAAFPLQTQTQTVLMRQYGFVRSLGKRPPMDAAIVPAYGVAAMPSLHVGAQAFLALWARRRCRPLCVLYTALALLTFLGSLITGWHYAVDGYAGLFLAWVSVWFGRNARPF